MKKKKHLLTFVSICMISVLAFTACGQKEVKQGNEAQGSQKASGSADAAKKQDEVVLTFAHLYPEDHQFAIGAKKIAEEIKSKSDGRLNVKVFPGGQMGNEKDIVEGVITGSIDLVMAGPGELGKRFKPVLIFDAPYVFRDPDHMMKTVNGPVGNELWNEMAEKTGLRVLDVLYLGTRYTTTSKVAVKTPDDMKNLKIRVPDQPMSIAIAKAMGASPTPMALAEVYLALQQGVVDGQENPLSQIVSFKFNEVQKYICQTNHVIQSIAITISDKKLKSLPEDLQKIVKDAVKNNTPSVNNAIIDFEKSTLNDLKSKGVQIVESDVEAFKKATSSVIKDNENNWGKGLYEKIQEVK